MRRRRAVTPASEVTFCHICHTLRRRSSRSFRAASSSSRACARPLSDSPRPASIRASSATRSSSSRRRTPLDFARPARAVDDQVDVGVGGDLRQVRDDDDLMGACQPRQPAADLHRGASADAGVDLVEHHRGALGRRREHHLQREHHPGQLTAGRALVQRQHVGAAVRGEPELDGVDAVAPGVHRRRPTAASAAPMSSARARQRRHGDA